jgi:hypothetical protein
LAPIARDGQAIAPRVAVHRQDGVQHPQGVGQRSLARQAREVRQRHRRIGIFDQFADEPGFSLQNVVGDHLEVQRRDAIEEVAQFQILEHDIGQAAPGGAALAAFGGGDERIDRLVSPARVEPHRAAGLEVARLPAQQVAVGPDPAQPGNRPAGERHRERGGVAVGGDRRPALAAAALLAVLDEVGRPDDRAGHAHPPEMARQRLAVGGSGGGKLLEPRPLAPAAADDRAVDGAPRERAERAAERPADQRADGGEENCRHEFGILRSGASGAAPARQAVRA